VVGIELILAGNPPPPGKRYNPGAMFLRVSGLIAVSLLLSACGAPADVDWPVNGGVDGIRYSPLTEITRDNVGQLQVAWSYDSGDAFEGSEMQANPIVVDGVLYATTPALKVIALDAAAGTLLWSFDPLAATGAPRTRARHRGVTVHEDRVFVAARSFLWALDKQTGQPIASFGQDGRLDLREGMGRPAETLSVSASSPGAVFEDLLIMGSSVPETLPGSPGHIRAFDVRTGEQRWIFRTIPAPGELGHDTWPPDAHEISGGANAWAGVTVDAGAGLVFAATGSASFDFYGANRHGDNLFANSLLALDARTGERVWHFQGIHHDVWDWDFPAAPSLVTVRREGRRIEAVAQLTKTGYVYVFDRHTGEPLFPIEERPVPPSAIDGELLAPTQPYPLLPPPFARQGLTEDMLTRRTPEANAAVVEQFRALEAGMYAPPSLKGTIVFPGFDGGAEWGGAAFDPDSGLLYVNSNEMPWIVQMIPNNDTALYQANCGTCHGDDRAGSPAAPALHDAGERFSRDELAAVIRQGTGTMPGFPELGGRNTNDIVDFLITGIDGGVDAAVTSAPGWLPYRNTGYTLWRDPDGYPPISPPWGTLNAVDLDRGAIRWQIPFGEYPELVEQGLTDTGSDNYGGPVVTASGLLFIGATNFDNKFRAYDAASGALLWETILPAAGNATPAVYRLDGRQYIVIACGGGKNGAPSGSTLVAFALPERD